MSGEEKEAVGFIVMSPAGPHHVQMASGRQTALPEFNTIVTYMFYSKRDRRWKTVSVQVKISPPFPSTAVPKGCYVVYDPFIERVLRMFTTTIKNINGMRNAAVFALSIETKDCTYTNWFSPDY